MNGEAGPLETVLGCIFAIVIFAAIVAIWWKIFQKSGHPPALSILMVVPLANLVLLLYFAFSEWPIQRRLRELERSQSPPTRPPEP